MKPMKALLLVVAMLVAGCAASHKPKGSLPPGPNYSTTPCAENCGTDATCNASCTPVGSPGQPPPVTFGH